MAAVKAKGKLVSIVINTSILRYVKSLKQVRML